MTRQANESSQPHPIVPEHISEPSLSAATSMVNRPGSFRNPPKPQVACSILNSLEAAHTHTHTHVNTRSRITTCHGRKVGPERRRRSTCSSSFAAGALQPACAGLALLNSTAGYGRSHKCQTWAHTSASHTPASVARPSAASARGTAIAPL